MERKNHYPGFGTQVMIIVTDYIFPVWNPSRSVYQHALFLICSIEHYWRCHQSHSILITESTKRHSGCHYYDVAMCATEILDYIYKLFPTYFSSVIFMIKIDYIVVKIERPVTESWMFWKRRHARIAIRKMTTGWHRLYGLPSKAIWKHSGSLLEEGITFPVQTLVLCFLI